MMPEPTTKNGSVIVTSVDEALVSFDKLVSDGEKRIGRRLPAALLIGAAAQLVADSIKAGKDEAFLVELGDALLDRINVRTHQTHVHVATGAIGGALALAGLKAIFGGFGREERRRNGHRRR